MKLISIGKVIEVVVCYEELKVAERWGMANTFM